MKRAFDILPELSFRAVRASGPGGQNVNKVNSKVELRWTPHESKRLSPALARRFSELFGTKLTKDGELVITCGQHREQPRNREECLERLSKMLDQAAVPKRKRKKTRVPCGAEEARKRAKKFRARQKSQRRSVRETD